jgi:hypothetical protein
MRFAYCAYDLNEKREAVGYGPVASGDQWE